MCSYNPKLEMFIQLYDDMLCAISNSDPGDDSVEFAAHPFVLIIVCDLNTELKAQISHDEPIAAIVETAVLVRQSEVAFADAYVQEKNNIVDGVIGSEYQFSQSP